MRDPCKSGTTHALEGPVQFTNNYRSLKEKFCVEQEATVVGKDITRIDGTLKVTGGAEYGVEYSRENLAWGVGISSTIGAGKISNIDSAGAQHMPGVLAVLHHGNTEKLFRAANNFAESSRPGESRPSFEDDQVHYHGQFVALVVADTFEREEAAAHVKVKYEERKPDVSTDDLPPKNAPNIKHERVFALLTSGLVWDLFKRGSKQGSPRSEQRISRARRGLMGNSLHHPSLMSLKKFRAFGREPNACSAHSAVHFLTDR